MHPGGTVIAQQGGRHTVWLLLLLHGSNAVPDASPYAMVRLLELPDVPTMILLVLSATVDMMLLELLVENTKLIPGEVFNKESLQHLGELHALSLQHVMQEGLECNVWREVCGAALCSAIA